MFGVLVCKKPCFAHAGLAKSGSSTWARTRDLRINSPALYRLSYRGTSLALYTQKSAFLEFCTTRMRALAGKFAGCAMNGFSNSGHLLQIWLRAQPKPDKYASHEGGSHGCNPELGACDKQDHRTQCHQNGGIPFGSSPHATSIGPVTQHDSEKRVIPKPFVKPGRAACCRPRRHQNEHRGGQARDEDADDPQGHAQDRKRQQGPAHYSRKRLVGGGSGCNRCRAGLGRFAGAVHGGVRIEENQASLCLQPSRMGTSNRRTCSRSFHGVRCPAKAVDVRRKPQPGWWPGEDLQRRRRCIYGATLRARQQPPRSRRLPQPMLAAWARRATTSVAVCCLAYPMKRS